MAEPRTDGRTTRWAGHREQRRAAFVDAALAVIDRVGPQATVDQVAAEVGVTRQALYRQFADRRDLDHAIAERAAGLLVEALLPLLEGGPALTEDVDGAARRVLHAYLDFVQAHLPLYRFVRAHEAELDAGSAVRQVKDTVSGRIAAVAGSVAADLDLPPTATGVFATGMVGMADAVIGRWLDDPQGLGRDALVEQLATMFAGAVEALRA